MNTKALNSLADLICRAQEQDRTPMGIAFAVDAAGRHMSPETAAELESLRAEVAALREERRETNEWVDDAARALRADRDRIAALEAELVPDGIVRRIAPTQALQSAPLAEWVAETFSPKPAVEGEFHAYLHRAFTTPHDLDFPGTGGAR